jgi:hypothetical protein
MATNEQVGSVLKVLGTEGNVSVVGDFLLSAAKGIVRAIMPDEEVVRDAIQFNAEAQASFRSVSG